jgi:Family of unknown function (DUF6510)
VCAVPSSRTSASTIRTQRCRPPASASNRRLTCALGRRKPNGSACQRRTMAGSRPMAELMLYAVELGAILHCPSCDQAVVRIGRTPRGLWLDLRGATTVVAADPATP